MDSQLSSSFFTYKYDVFLSFRGEDTQYRFIDNLYKALSNRGIHTFIDYEELQQGGEITPSLLQAIRESKIAIIVFSENYATSSFCLDVLAYIIGNFQSQMQIVFPVFYNVDPYEVRKQIGAYGEAMAKHEVRFKDNIERVQKWRYALSQAADLSGWHFNPREEYEYQLIENIVKDISSRCNHASLHFADYQFIGLESRVREVCSLLEFGYDDRVLMLGIYGIGGVGKTTLARVVYNMIAHQFEGSCFLNDVRENSKKKGLTHLQERLLHAVVGEEDIQLGNVNQGLSIIMHRLHRKKVLLILDDVDKIEQLEAFGRPDWFGPGSRIIITTRDKHLLAFHGVESVYKVEELNDKDALELLSRKAFRQDSVNPSYTELLHQAVTYASGLPLALEVIGSDLFGKSVDEWRHALAIYKNIPPHDIQKILKASFRALSEGEQNVFLDIACCFKGYELAEVEDILHAHYGYNVKHSIKALAENSLISISLDGKVTMQPLLEDIGKEIVRQESPEPRKRSRLWYPEDIVEVLVENSGTSEILLIHLDCPLIDEKEVEVKWDGEAFKHMKKLRTLIIKNCHFSLAPKHLPNSLRVLEWLAYPSEELPSDFHGKKLARLKLPINGIMSPNLSGLLETSQSIREVLQTSQRVPQVTLQSAPGIFHAETIWRLVGLASSVVGLVCYALSPSFNRLIGGWSSVKCIFYGVLSFVVFATILFVKQSSLSTHQGWLRAHVSFAVLMIMSVYSFFYDKAVNGRPEVLSLVSNAAFALVSLSLSKLIKFGFEMGVFSFFLGCLVIQLLTINWKLIFIAIILGCPLFVIHSSSDSQPEVGNGSQVIHSSSNSRPEVGSGVQHVIDMHT